MNVKNKHIIDNIIWSIEDDEKNIFDRIYFKNLWYSKESISGKGSEMDSVKNILTKLPKLFSNLDIVTILDAPCGDYSWMNKMNYHFKNYIGIDIVEDLSNENNKKYTNNNVNFKCLNIISDNLPKADIILCRDCFIHLSFDDILKTIQNFKNSNSKYLLTTTYKNLKNNINIYNGGFRKINLELPPFNFSKSEFEIQEQDDKFLSLWRLDCI